MQTGVELYSRYVGLIAEAMTTEAKFWDNIAEKYAASPVKNVTAFERKQAITRQHLRADSNVIEIGCGTGSLALALSPCARHIHALDFSAAMIRIASSKQQAQGVRNVTFQQGTLDGAIPFEPETFDCALAFSILHLVPDRLQLLRNVRKLLKPGGSFISSNVCLGDSRVPYGPLISVARWFGRAPAVHIYDRATLMRELRDAGFTQLQEQEVGAEKIVAFVVASKPS
jgi:ubiquinone/menaquinone biosynthesis C-methylase UbiE